MFCARYEIVKAISLEKHPPLIVPGSTTLTPASNVSDGKDNASVEQRKPRGAEVRVTRNAVGPITA